MKKFQSLISAAIFISLILSSCSEKKSDDYGWVKNAIDVAVFQLTDQLPTVDSLCLDTVAYPRSYRDGKYRLAGAKDWTVGFYPGNLWYAYELSGDKGLETAARKFTDKLFDDQFYEGTHDLGFMMFCSYGNAQRLAPQTGDTAILLNSAKSLASRFNPMLGVIRSWDFGEWSYPVIIDNMMNLDMLFWAAKQSGDSTFCKIATRHADVTMENHFRSDMSTYHVISYDPIHGGVESKGTHQGYSDSSAWARGQAWGLYGYSLCYRETGDKKYLDRAEAIAAYLMNHHNMPTDHIPYWDFDAPNIPDAPRDASAAAVICAAMLEMSTMVPEGAKYFDYAEGILKTLSSNAYLAEKGTNNGFILRHSVGHLPANSEIDTPLNYADYYYLESIKRYCAIKNIDPKTL